MKLKRLLVPRFWKVPKKVKKWAVSPRPGPHKKFESIPLQVIIRDILKLAETGNETKKIISKGEILVDGKVRKDHAYPVGLFDVVSIPKLNQSYRVVPTGYGLDLLKISEKESNLKICEIKNKTVVKKGRMQLNLSDGKNILVDKDEYHTGDSLLIEIPSLKIVESIKLDKNNVGIVVMGKNSGKVGVVKDVIVSGMKEPSKVICEVDNKNVEVLKDHFFVVGKEKPLITVG